MADERKKGWSTGTKVLVGVGVTAAGLGLAWWAFRPKAPTGQAGAFGGKPAPNGGQPQTDHTAEDVRTGAKIIGSVLDLAKDAYDKFGKGSGSSAPGDAGGAGWGSGGDGDQGPPAGLYG